MRTLDITKLLWRILFLMTVMSANSSLSQSNPNASSLAVYNPWVDPNIWYFTTTNGSIFADICPDIYLKYPRRCGIYNSLEKAMMEFFCTRSEYLDMIFNIAALSIGVLGNAFILLVVFKMPTKPSTIYLGILAVTDSGTIITVCSQYVAVIDTYPKIFAFLIMANAFRVFSNWVLFLICIERYSSIRWPFQKAKIFTIRNTVISAVVFVLISIASMTATHLYALYPALFTYYEYFYLATCCCYLYLPSFCIVLFTALTAKELWHVQRNRQKMSAGRTSASSKMEADLTRIMLVASFTFTFLMVLNIIMSVWVINLNAVWSPYTASCPLTREAAKFLVELGEGATMLNHAINFYIYFIYAPGFRKTFLCAIRCKPQDTKTETQAISQDANVNPSTKSQK